MGENLYCTEIESRDIRLVFNQLVDNARYSYGDDPYNGTISTTSLARIIYYSDKYGKRIASKFNKEPKEKFYPNKWETNAVNLGLVGYQPYSTSYSRLGYHISHAKGERWVNNYVIVRQDNSDLVYRGYITLSGAKRDAKEYALKHGIELFIEQQRSTGDYVRVAAMNLEANGKLVHTQRSSKTKAYLPIYHYVLFVGAGC